MILATISIVCWLVSYAALCVAQPFNANGKLRIGRRAWNALRRTRDAGTR